MQNGGTARLRLMRLIKFGDILAVTVLLCGPGWRTGIWRRRRRSPWQHHMISIDPEESLRCVFNFV
jgi:hypothetical protein